MIATDPVVFLLDVDNTLLDNDRFAADFTARLEHDFGKVECERYWSIYAGLRDQQGYADYLGALQDFRAACDDEPALLQISAFLLEYPFRERLYPRALAAVEHLRSLGTAVILSDGDIVFQPRKIQRSGLWDAVAGRVLVCVHKERMLEAIRQRYPATHYVMIDDKPQLLATVKRMLGDRLTTIFVRQGHYAAASERIVIDPAPDVIVKHMGDLCDLALRDLHAVTASRAAAADHQRMSQTVFPEQP
jgi:FMN phosphatase YigB (HAD superfamily)